VAIDGNRAYVGDYDGKFSCYDLKTHHAIWQWDDPQGDLPFLASPAIHEQWVIGASRDRSVYAFDKNSGRQIWKTDTGNRVDASPVIAGNKVVTANMRGDLMIMNLSDGKIIWSYELGSAVAGNPAITGGKIIVGAADGFVYCLGSKQP